MGKVQQYFTNGAPGAVSRSNDEVIIAVKNAGGGDIAFGAPVFLASDGSGAEPFNITTPQEFSAFLGFAVKAESKTPDAYPSGQDNDAFSESGAWHNEDVIEVLVRGNIVVKMATACSTGSKVYIRKSDGKLTASAGTSGSTVQLENCTVRNTRDSGANTAEIVVRERNIL